MLTLIGTFLGIFARFLPEILAWFDKRDERKHELAMLAQQLEVDRAMMQMEIQKINAQAEVTLGAKEIDAIISATRAQGTKTGIGWVDAINSLMRPIITFWWVIVLYTAAMAVQFYGLIQYGMSAPAALLTVFSTDEKAIAASIISFWFVDRSLRKMKGK